MSPFATAEGASSGKPDAPVQVSRRSALHIEQSENCLRLAVDLIDPAIVVAVIRPIIVDIIVAVLHRHALDAAGDVLAYPRIAIETVAGMQSCEPRIGDPVWLATKFGGASNPTTRMHPAVVTSLENRLLEYRFEESAVALQDTSGSPVLDRRGDVVGIHLGAGSEDGRIFGVANPSLCSCHIYWRLAGATRRADPDMAYAITSRLNRT